MVTSKVVTGMVPYSVRINDDASRFLTVTVTYSDATTEKLELQIVRTGA